MREITKADKEGYAGFATKSTMIVLSFREIHRQ